ncbi:DUF2017 domain-containing protein [Citricoccus nitrophenolicus]|uniref:Uncharacterized protein DUF2017 n=1 Tax=Citricoccus muralis TaxID=169134 RepID=A0A3D9L8K2_9MICC|nr:DUF2017 family protein [Citricoccus muralis]REE02691.1 uncharacterized protein DUF2017 [Citricoccus muralis]
MARAFKSTPKGFVADLEKAERRLLRTLFKDVIQLLDVGQEAPTESASTSASISSSDPFWDIVAELGPLGADDAGGGEVAGVGNPVGAGESTPVREAPQDEALARLLPPGVHGDTPAEQAAAGEFRALTEDGVRRAKTADLQRAVAALQVNPVVLDEEHAIAFSRALNDVRLVLSARLGIDTDEDAERVHAVDDWSAAKDVESYMALLYNFTTWLLETLMLALSTRLPD